MDRLGFIHEKLDIKILILFILRRLPGTVDRDMLSDFTQCDGGVGAFDEHVGCGAVRPRATA